ncbi:MAG: ABC transporter ATP-binding protein [Oscillospiraceae bacterium]|nr:ABC transporter ATP-binding protein [Oscillospiraceae bacterium]
MSENTNFLEVKDLVVEYTADGEIVHAVNGISLSLKKGETLGLVGETGAGKTTIAKAILKILPDPPAKIRQGEIILDGVDLLKAPEKDMLKIRGAKIAMIFQDPMTALNPLMTVGDQIMEVVQLHNNFTKQEALEHTFQMLEMVGIPRVRSVEFPHQFSGGMKQRVVIAMALACNPELLLADEPTTALDVTIQAQVLEMINELKVKLNSSMILITHDLGVVAQTCDKVAVIYAGEIMESGSKEDLFLNPSHPYTLGLFGSLPKMDDDSKRLTPIRGMPLDPTLDRHGCPFADRCSQATKACHHGVMPNVEVSKDHFVRCIKFAKEAN